MKLLLIPGAGAGKTAAMLDEIISFAGRMDIQLLALSSDRGRLPHGVSEAADIQFCDDRAFAAQECDVILTVGGDGTLLHTAALASSAGRPIAGADCGRLGFLCRIPEDKLTERLTMLSEGSFSIERRSTLRADILPGRSRIPFALNDIVFRKAHGDNVISLGASCCGTDIYGFTGDGLIFATPTGSTAYSLSAGGPIADPGMNAMIASPLCPHTLYARPMVLAPNRVVTVQCSGAASVFVDGCEFCDLPPDNETMVCVSDRCVDFISFDDADIFCSPDKKMERKNSVSF